jgi:hypothetical protein
MLSSLFTTLFMLYSPFIVLFMLYSPFIALFMLSSPFIALFTFFKFIYRFIYIYYVLVNICVVIPPSPCVLVRQPRVALVDYVNPL